MVFYSEKNDKISLVFPILSKTLSLRTISRRSPISHLKNLNFIHYNPYNPYNPYTLITIKTMSTQTHISQCLKLLALHSPSSQILSAKSLLYRGWPLYLITLDQITSTMLLSENWPEEQTVGSSFCFLARRQTQGKGQG